MNEPEPEPQPGSGAGRGAGAGDVTMSAKWAGWGAGPAGAGSAGGPSRLFLVVALAGSAVVAAILARDGRLAAAGVAASAAVYFALRLFAGLGKGGTG